MRDRPAWCELEHFQIVSLGSGEEHVWRAAHDANKMVVVDGSCRIVRDDGTQVVEPGESVDAPAGELLVVCDERTTLVELGGRWGNDCGGAGIFAVDRADQAADHGDPITYPKHTTFDRHYHDCDEYWILVAGRGTASSEDELYQVGPGDCIATRMGHHHDFPLVDEPVRAVYFETTMRGERRPGHLWEHTHGPAKPSEMPPKTGADAP